ncbi:MAG: Rid family detoxifying hydrolase [Steroidobacteraceae bacterium]|jgi:reactive intermediate/imine deaminase|nr:RidA family protein [Gammaproteobacteria bacterium]
MSREIIQTPNAPAAIGTYSQAVRVGQTVYISGQIPLDPQTGEMVSGDIDAEIERVFNNLAAIAEAAGASLAQAARVTVFLTDLAHFARVNEIMARFFPQPWPARAALGVAQLPRGARVEVDCILYLD